MAETTEIAWCDATFNGWIGCDKVSAGCKNCYASVDTFARRSRANGLELWGAGAARHRTSEEYWRKPYKWNREAREGGKRRRVFCSSLADVFEYRRDLDPWRRDLFRLIEETEWLDWLLLTKRPENMIRLAPASWAKAWPRNVWAGCTVEDQANADRRVPELLRVPTAVRFLSVEPMLEFINLSAALFTQPPQGKPDESPEAGGLWNGPRALGRDGVQWVIVGGESGPGARPMHPDWPAAIASQCAAAGVPYFWKQQGALLPFYDRDCDDPDWRNVPKEAPNVCRINLAGGQGFHGDRVVYFRRTNEKNGDPAAMAKISPANAAAGVFRREWPESRP